MIHLVHRTRGTACVGNHWFCEVMTQREEIMNYKNIEYSVIIIIFGQPDKILPEPEHEIDLKVCFCFDQFFLVLLLLLK